MSAHWALSAFFTATSMIGFIAGVGIIVRNSIILVRLALFDSEDTLMGSAGAAATAVRTLTLDRARSARSVP